MREWLCIYAMSLAPDSSLPEALAPLTELPGHGKSTFFRGLLLALLAVLLPVIGLQAYTLYHAYRSSEQQVHAEVRLRSDAGARVAEELLRRGEMLLLLLANRVEARQMEREACARLFGGVDLVSPVFGNLTLADTQGRRICSMSRAPGAAEPEVESNDWFPEAMHNATFTLSRPRVGQTSLRKIALLSMPVRGQDGQRVGLLSVSLDLVRFSEALEPGVQTPGLAVTLLFKDGTVLARFPEGEKYAGAKVFASTARQEVNGAQDIAVYHGVDDVPRVFAATPLNRFDLRVAAGVPAVEAYAAANATVVGSAVVTFLLLGAAIALSAGLARYFSSPVVTLVRETRRVARGEREEVNAALPGEFGVLAAEFNRLLRLQAAHAQQIELAAARAEKMNSVYQALSGTNRAISRTTDRQELFDEICGICVNFGHAKLARIALQEGREAVFVATARLDDENLLPARLSLALHSADATNPVATALREGTIVVVNDFRADPRTARLRDEPWARDVKSAAAVPFQKGGRTVGVLSLKSTRIDYFDAAMTALLLEVASDLSFALDNIEREREREQAQELSRRHEEQLVGIIKTAMDAIITVDADLRVVVFNEAAANVFGLPATQAMGKHLNEFIPPRFHAVHDSHVAGFLHTGSTTRAMGAGLELRGLRSDGTEFPVEASISRLGAGRDLLMTVVLRDISRSREAEALREARLVEEAATRARADFLARVSHELRTPLNAVLGFTRLVASSAKSRLTEQEATQLQGAVTAGSQLRALIDDVLDVTRLEAGTLNIALQPVRLSVLLDQALTVVEAAAGEANISIERRYFREASVTVRSDPVRLQQVFTNLLSNAVKYNRPGGTVTVTAALKASAVEVEVSDTGMGMSEQQLEQLFQPFNRLGRERSNIAGTGIGLLLSRDLVELVGGSLTVASRVGQGTTFTVALPLLDGASDSALAAFDATDEADQERPALEGRVLYIEDTPVNASIVQQLLGRWPAVKVAIAEDGASGLRAVAEGPPDVILLDMALPDMTGLEVLARLKADPQTRHLPVVSLSASAMRHEVDEALKAGAADYWTKPIDFDKFLGAMRRYLKEVQANA